MKTPFPYQLTGAEFLAACPPGEGRLLLDVPGIGKTLQAILAAQRAGAGTILVVCLAVGRPHWERELAEQFPWQRVCALQAARDYALVRTADIVVVSWDLLHDLHIFAALRQRQWDVLILDEGHCAKNPTAKRTTAVYGEGCAREGGLVERAKQTFVLTGTPVSSGPHDFWTHYRALFPHATRILLDYDEWVEAMCVTGIAYYRTKVLGARPDAVERLKERLGPYVLRRTKAQVQLDLPPMRAVDAPVAVLGEDAAAIKQLVREQGLEGATLSAIADAGVDLSSLNIGSLSALLRALGMAKAKPAVDLLWSELEGGLEKVVVFARHRDVLDRLEAGLKKQGVVRLDGSTKPAARQEAIDRFQTDPKVRVFLGQIDAASTSITLTAASDVVVVEPSWTPAVNMQAIQRIHRIGQTKPVLARFLFAAGTLDELIAKALARKAATLEALGLEE